MADGNSAAELCEIVREMREHFSRPYREGEWPNRWWIGALIQKAIELGAFAGAKWYLLRVELQRCTSDQERVETAISRLQRIQPSFPKGSLWDEYQICFQHEFLTECTAVIADIIEREIRSEPDKNSDNTKKPDRKIRPASDAARAIGAKIKRASERVSRQSAFDEYLSENPGTVLSFWSIDRELTDHPELWKKPTKSRQKADK